MRACVACFRSHFGCTFCSLFLSGSWRAMSLRHVFPKYYGCCPPRDANQITWEDTRPPDDLYWEKVAELKRRGGFAAGVQLVALHSKPGGDALLAMEVTPYQTQYFPQLLLPGAMDNTAWEGVPLHMSLCFASECSDELLRKALKRWGRRRTVWVSCARVTSGAACELRKRGSRGSLVACPILRQMHAKGYYKHRPLHISL